MPLACASTVQLIQSFLLWCNSKPKEDYCLYCNYSVMCSYHKGTQETCTILKYFTKINLKF
jgi:hypothetical protein